MAEEAPDFDELEETLHVVGTSARLEILHQLRLPGTVADLRIAARTGAGGRAASLMARQSVTEHVQKLVDIGVLRPAEGSGVEGPRQFVVNGARFYQIVEELRRVGSMLAARTAASMDLTIAQPSKGLPSPQLKGPRLVIVHGLLEGKSFALPARKAEVWMGRGKGCDIALDYDPFVSARNSVLQAQGKRWMIRDSGQSRNGTHVNWNTVSEEPGVELVSGAVIGVGRSLLVFQDDAADP